MNTGAANPRRRFDGAPHRERDVSPSVRDQHAAQCVASLSLRLAQEVSCHSSVWPSTQTRITVPSRGTVAFLVLASPPSRDISPPRLR